jgi:hypothetical protein
LDRSQYSKIEAIPAQTKKCESYQKKIVDKSISSGHMRSAVIDKRRGHLANEGHFVLPHALPPSHHPSRLKKKASDVTPRQTLVQIVIDLDGALSKRSHYSQGTAKGAGDSADRLNDSLAGLGEVNEMGSF